MMQMKAAIAGTRLGAALLPRHSQIQARYMAIELGAREQALLQDDPILHEFRDTKNKAKVARKVADGVVAVLTLGFAYELYYRWTNSKEK